MAALAAEELDCGEGGDVTAVSTSDTPKRDILDYRIFHVPHEAKTGELLGWRFLSFQDAVQVIELIHGSCRCRQPGEMWRCAKGEHLVLPIGRVEKGET